MPESTLRFTVENQYSALVVVYSTASKPVTTPPSSDADAYQPVYTRLGTVAPSKKESFTAASSPTRIVVTRETDDFPLALAIVETSDASSQAVTVNAASYATTQKAWKFYQSFASEPYQPVALQFSELVLNSTDPAQLDQQVASFFTANGDQGVDLGVFSIVSHWATNSLQAFPGTLLVLRASARHDGVRPADGIGRPDRDPQRDRGLHRSAGRTGCRQPATFPGIHRTGQAGRGDATSPGTGRTG